MVSVKHLQYVFFCCLLSGFNTVQAAPESRTQTETVRVAVASNFKPVLEQLIRAFKRQYPASQIQLSSASSAVLYAQILRGAPFDLFLSADRLRPAMLEEQGMTLANSRVTYALGSLVFWSPNKTVQGLDALPHYTGKIAIANPELAPFGRASQQALTALALLPAKKNNMVMANNVLQVAHMLHSGAVNLGMVSASQVRNVPKQQFWLVPKDLFSPIDQQVVILNQTKRQAHHFQEVKAFYRYILSTKGQQIIADNGYGVTINSMTRSEYTGD